MIKDDITANRLVPVLEEFNPGDLDELHAVYLGKAGCCRHGFASSSIFWLSTSKSARFSRPEMPDRPSAARSRACLLSSELYFIQEAVGLGHESLVILIPGTVIGVGIEHQLGVGQILREIERIHRVDDDVMVPA